MVRYKKRYCLVFVSPPLTITLEKIQYLLKQHVLKLFGISHSEMAQSLQVIYYHPFTGTLIIRTNLNHIHQLRVLLLYFSSYDSIRFNAITQHTSGTIKQLSKVFEQKIRHYIIWNAQKCDPIKMKIAIDEVMEGIELAKNK